MATLCTNTDVYRVTGLNSDAIPTADVDQFILDAEDEIRNLTNKWWGGTATAVEYFNRRKSLYRRSPPQQIGYIYSDTTDDSLNTDYVVLSKIPLQSIQRAYILDRDIADLSQVWSLNAPAAWADNTAEANTVGGTAFDAFAAASAIGDILYIGYSSQWEDVTLLFVTPGVDGGATALAYEYWNGAAWVAIPTVIDNTNLLTNDGVITFQAPRDWAQTVVNASANLFYIRIRITAANYTTEPTLSQIFMPDVIEEELNTRDIQTYHMTGKAVFIDEPFTAGLRDLKIRYTYGQATVPSVVRDFAACLAGLRALVFMIGGSYDDVTNYSVPEFSASKGEPYTNLRATIIEMQKRLYGWTGGERGEYNPGLLKLIGLDIPFAVSGIDNESDLFV